MQTPLVACENVVKIYALPAAGIEVVALQGLDLEVSQGELLALVGQSGSGKTTLLNILGTLDRPTAGRCSVGGYDLSHLRERERNHYRRHVVGQVWQQSGRNLLPDLTTEDNVRLPLLLARAPASRRGVRARELLKAVGLGGKEHAYPRQLSGGEQQRGAIAVALANSPALLLADEPTGELDSVAATEVLTVLQQLNRNLGLTIILVTHDPTAAALADRTIAIRDGRTSTETVRRETNSPGGAMAPAAVIDRVGRLQLPEGITLRLTFDGRAEVRVLHDHVELWPLDVLESGDISTEIPASAVIGLPGETHHEAVLIDRVGRLQLPAEAVERLAFGGRAEVRILADHVELWPAHAAALEPTGNGAGSALLVPTVEALEKKEAE